MREKRIALVTGGSRGIGKGIASCLMDAGYKVAVGYHQGRKDAEFIAGSHGMAVHIDVGCDVSVKSAINQIEKEWGAVDTLINNAGIAQFKPFLDITDDEWIRMLSINLLGAVRCIRRVIPNMMEMGFGRIVNIASVGGQWGGVFQPHYAASKAGLINLSKSIAKLYSQHGITCNTVSPGLIQTEMISDEIAIDGAQARIANIPVGRIGTVEDVASVVECICAVRSGYITGQTINVNGGMYLG